MTDGDENKQESSGSPDHPPGAPKKKSSLLGRLFWLSFLIASLGYAWHSFYVPSNQVNWAADIPSARQTATESEKPVLMFFTADWCVPCRIMKRKVFADPDVMRVVNADVVPVMIYADEPGANEAFERYNVKGTPITILTDPQGEVIRYAVGGITKSEFLELLEKP